MKQARTKIFGILFIFIGLYALYNKGLHANILHTLSVKEAYAYMQNHPKVTILDVRSQDEFEDDGSLLGATLIPLYLLEEKMNFLDKNRVILVYCHSGRRSSLAGKLLTKHGFTVLNIKGGMSAWVDNELPYEF